MADYDLGTAHGKIVVTYDDRGVAEAEKSLDRLKRKSRELLSQFGSMVQGMRAQAAQLGQSARQLNTDFVHAAEGVAILGTALSALRGDLGGVYEGIGLIRSFGEAMGALPDGAERFPSVVRRIIQVSAAVTLFHGATGLLARATRNLTGISFLTRGLAGLGGILNNAAAPLRFIASGFLGFLTVLKGFAVVKQYAKYALIFNTALAALGGGLKVLYAVGQSVVDLSGLVLLLPAAAGAAAFGLVALKVATQGFGEAMKNMGDPAKFAEALKKLSPEAQTAAKAVQALQKDWKKLQQEVQNKLFAGLGPEITKVANAYLPLLREGFGRIATAANLAAKGVAGVLTSTKGMASSRAMLGDFARIWENLLKAVPGLTRVLLAVGEVGARVLGNLTANVGKTADAFAAWVETMASNGKMEAWIMRGVTALKNLGTALKNMGQIAKIVFQGLGLAGGQPFLTWLASATQGVENFLKSAQGQEVLRTLGTMLQNAADNAKKLADAFLTYVLPAIQAFLPFMQQMSGAVIDGLVNAMVILGPLFKALGETLSILAPVLTPIVTAMVTMGAVMIGLGVAAKIAGAAIAIFRTGVMALRAITGILGLLGRATGAVRTFAAAAGLIKGAAVAAGLFLIADGLNEINLAAVGGDESKLGMMEENLNDIVKAGKQILSGDIAGIVKEIGDELAQVGETWSKGEAPVQQWTATVNKGIMDTKVSIGQWAVDFGTSINTGMANARTATGTFFSTLGTTISTAIGTANTTIKETAGRLWDSFLQGLREKFAPVIAFFQQTPYQMGFAIGSAIGDFLRRGQELMTNFLTGIKTGYIAIDAWFKGLPLQIGMALVNLGTTIKTWATTTWNDFWTPAKKAGDDITTSVTGLPGRLSGGFESLKVQVGQAALNAWNQFITWTQTKVNEAVAFVQQAPSKISNALTQLKTLIGQKAIEAWNGFLNSTRQKAEEIAGFVRGIPGKIQSALGNMGNLLVAAGRAVIDGLLSGIRAGVQVMYDFVSGIAAGIAARKGPIQYDKKLLIPAGVAIINGLVRGMRMTLPELWREINKINRGLGTIGAKASTNLNVGGATTMAPNVSAIVGAPSWSTFAPRGGDGAKAPDTYNIESVTIDAKTIAEMQTVADFFDKVQQTARAGKAK